MNITLKSVLDVAQTTARIACRRWNVKGHNAEDMHAEAVAIAYEVWVTHGDTKPLGYYRQAVANRLADHRLEATSGPVRVPARTTRRALAGGLDHERTVAVEEARAVPVSDDVLDGQAWSPLDPVPTADEGVLLDLQVVLDGLPEMKARAVWLVDAEGWSVADTAAEMKVTTRTIERYLADARAVLRSKLEHHYDD